MLKLSVRLWESSLEYANSINIYIEGNLHFLQITTILSPSKAVPSMVAAHMQRWALLLAAHDYSIEYKKAELHGNANGLSRLPLPTLHSDKLDTVDVFHVNQLEILPVPVSR